jgi:hypothetical protein
MFHPTHPHTWIRLLTCIVLIFLAACNSTVNPVAATPTAAVSAPTTAPTQPAAPQTTATTAATSTSAATEIPQTPTAPQPSETPQALTTPQATATSQGSTALQSTATPPAVATTAPAQSSTQRVIIDKAELINTGSADGKIISATDAFTMKWTVKNVGPTTWTTDYHLVFYGGNQLDGKNRKSFPGRLEPGKETTLSIDLNAPRDPGIYHSYWALANPDGDLFKIVGVTIIVK